MKEAALFPPLREENREGALCKSMRPGCRRLVPQKAGGTCFGKARRRGRREPGEER